MPSTLVVEGITDAVFLTELLSRLYLPEVRVETTRRRGRENIPRGLRGVLTNGESVEVGFEVAGGTGGIPVGIRALLDTGVHTLAIVQDLDDSHPEQLVESVGELVSRHLGTQISTDLSAPRQINTNDGAIFVIAMGLLGDPSLDALGVRRHALEDYLIKLLLEDATLRQNAPELRSLLTQILPLIREKDGPFDSSKEIFQLIKPIVQHGFSDTGVVQKLMRDADEAILRSVLEPLLGDVERALGV